MALAEALREEEGLRKAQNTPKFGLGDIVVVRSLGPPRQSPTVGTVTEVHTSGTPAQGKVFWRGGTPDPLCCVYRVSYYDKHGPHRFHPEHEIIECVAFHQLRDQAPFMQ